jgi:hypothetical protein
MMLGVSIGMHQLYAFAGPWFFIGLISGIGLMHWANRWDRKHGFR